MEPRHREPGGEEIHAVFHGRISPVNGQVWECIVPAAHAERYAASFNTSNLRNTDRGETILRIISDRPPMENAVKVQPNLEDLYLFYFKGDTEE